MNLVSALRTEVGPREDNQDAAISLPELGLFAVADGMGGYAGGGVASRLALETMADFLRANVRDHDVTWPVAGDARLAPPARLLDAAIRLAHQRIRDARQGIWAKMGTTVAAVATSPRGLVVGHVGDSRVYRWRAGCLSRLTKDHTLVQDLIDAGVESDGLMDTPLAHVLSQALGASESVQADFHIDQPAGGDRYLLCTDGLTGAVTEERMVELLGTPDVGLAATMLIEEALGRGTRDNVTVMVIGVEGERREA